MDASALISQIRSQATQALEFGNVVIECRQQRIAVRQTDVAPHFRRTAGNARGVPKTASGMRQQRLCIARSVAVQPEVILFDEPCSALDPISTAKVEELIQDLRARFTIVIVTHNMQQAQRVSDQCAFFLAGENQPGYIVESGATEQLFNTPVHKETEDYVNGRFG